MPAFSWAFVFLIQTSFSYIEFQSGCLLSILKSIFVKKQMSKMSEITQMPTSLKNIKSHSFPHKRKELVIDKVST